MLTRRTPEGSAPSATDGNSITISLNLPERLMMLLETLATFQSLPSFAFSSTSPVSPAPAPPPPPVRLHVPPADVSPPPAAIASPRESDSPTFSELFSSHVLPRLRIEDKVSTIRAYQTAVRHFCHWFEQRQGRAPEDIEKDPRTMGPRVSDLQGKPTLLSEFFADSLACSSPKTATNKLKTIRTVWRSLHIDGHLPAPAPEIRSRMILKQHARPTIPAMPMPASDSELAALARACSSLRNRLTWPTLGTMPPARFWKLVIATCAVHGFRPADLWPLERSAGSGLLWEEVFDSPEPPLEGSDQLPARWSAGWLRMTINKTAETLIVPISPHLRELIEAGRGLDRVRVFPFKYLRKYWYANFQKITEAAGLSRNVTLSGQAPSASLRKAAAVRWKQHASRSAASHMLGHTFDQDERGFSAITERHYMRADVLREIVDAFPAVLRSLPPELAVS